MYEPRFYRQFCRPHDLVAFSVVIKETDVFILTEKYLKDQAAEAILEYRQAIEDYIEKNPLFLTSLVPMPDDPEAPLIIASMLRAAKKAEVGPMAAVAGTVAEFVGRKLLNYSPQVIVENGGDIFLSTSQKRIIPVYAGTSPFSCKIALEIEPEQSPLGVCTSSGTVGHSLSFGLADAVVVISRSAALADAAATAIGNLIQTKEDINLALEKAKIIEGVEGVVLIKDDQAGFWGRVKITGI